MNGNSQAVRIPQEFRLDAQRVEITRTPEGDLLIHPVPENRGDALLRALQGFDADMVAALENAHQELAAQALQERDAL
jgi:antitoxin VapB